MAQATTKKRQKAQPITVDSNEAKKYETIAVRTPNVKLFKGYKYDDPVALLIKFEKEKRNIGLKMINKRAVNGVSQSFTAIVNDGLDILLYLRGVIKLEQVSKSALDALSNINPKIKTTKQKVS